MDLPFSLTQKISEQDSIVWLKGMNKYIVLDSNLLELICKKSIISSKEFLAQLIKSLNVSYSVAKKIDKDISQLLLETKKVELKQEIKYPEIIKSCQLIQYYLFNDIIIKVCFDSEETKALIHPKYSHLVIDHLNIYDVEYKIFNNDNTFFIFKNNQFLGALNLYHYHLRL